MKRVAITADIKMYDNSNKSWKKIRSLSYARTNIAVAAVYNNAIVVFGGVLLLKSSSVIVVELGQVERRMLH